MIKRSRKTKKEILPEKSEVSLFSILSHDNLPKTQAADCWKPKYLTFFTKRLNRISDMHRYTHAMRILRKCSSPKIFKWSEYLERAEPNLWWRPPLWNIYRLRYWHLNFKLKSLQGKASYAQSLAYKWLWFPAIISALPLLWLRYILHYLLDNSLQATFKISTELLKLWGEQFTTFSSNGISKLKFA